MNKKCYLVRINAVCDHLHILVNIHPTVTVSGLIKDIKISSSLLIKKEDLFPGFKAWQIGYGAFSVSYRDKKRLIEYIKNQKEHHNKLNSKLEFISLLKENEIEVKPEYLG